MASAAAGLTAAALAATPVVARTPVDLPPPNVLWLSSEDNGPHLGAYGDDYATTPNLDRLAARGLVYLNAWSNSPVCAPARTTIISGLYPASTGAHHMRSRSRLPDGFLFFPQYLRQAGYYVTNNAKEDYNLEKPGGEGAVWHVSSREAHWRNRPEGAPFFAVFNFTVTHESSIRRRPHVQVHDPAAVRVPAYHPDTPEVRQDWAQYYDKLTEMDALVGERLAELAAAGLADDTIVFYWADHGPGLPRSKRTALQTGLGVPLIVSIPEKYRHLAPADYEPGRRTDRLVGFIDFAPTMLSLAGIEPPPHFQGRAFLGAHEAAPNEYLFGFADRMDERYDLVRSVRDKRYLYAINYMPDRPYGQRLAYQMETPTTQVWLREFEEGNLTEAQAAFWRKKRNPEFYDLKDDPDLIHDLAASEEHVADIERLSGAMAENLFAIRDLGFLPESEVHRRAASIDATPWDYGRTEQGRIAVARLIGDTVLAADSEYLMLEKAPSVLRLHYLLGDTDPAVRVWAAIGLRIRGSAFPLSGFSGFIERAVEAGDDLPSTLRDIFRQPADLRFRGELAGAEPVVFPPTLRDALADASPPVRIHVAEVLARYGDDADRVAAVDVLLTAASIEDNDFFDALLALNALDYLEPDVLGADGPQAAAWRERLRALPSELEGLDRRLASYVPRLLEAIWRDLPDP